MKDDNLGSLAILAVFALAGWIFYQRVKPSRITPTPIDQSNADLSFAMMMGDPGAIADAVSQVNSDIINAYAYYAPYMRPTT